jgi:hypothetical protein
MLIMGILQSQTLPSERSANWHQAGCTENYPEELPLINLLDFGGLADGISDNSTAIESAISFLDGNPGVIYIPVGYFHFTRPIHLTHNIILRGASASATFLTFNLQEEGHLINAIGERSDEVFLLSEDALKTEQKITLHSETQLASGDYIYLFEEDQDLVSNDWAIHSTGQICRVALVDGNDIFLEEELRRNFQTNKQARITKVEPVRKAGVENLSLERQDINQNQTSNIYFKYAADCWVKCVESIKCNFAHVTIEQSTHVDVAGSYFHHAFDYGNGGKAYGVVLQQGSGDCLIENNVFKRLRHSMLLQSGANGNVLSYNYSFDPYWTGVQLPSNSAGDLVLHGNYPYANLFEGNIVQNLIVDDSHGINGPLNTFFRNRVELYGIFMNSDPVSNQQNFIGNEITNPGFLLGMYYVIGDDHFEFGNNDLGTIMPYGTAQLPESSLYRDNCPDYFPLTLSWPSIGAPNELEAFDNPAKLRFEESWMTACEVQDVVSSTQFEETSTLAIYPNPVREYLNITTEIPIENIRIYNANGQLVKQSTQKLNQIHLETLENGLYSLFMQLANHEIIVRKFIKS